MVTPRILRYPPILRLFAFLAIVVFLASSGRRGYALASPARIGSTRFDSNSNDADARQYPNDDEIEAAFLGVHKDNTVLSAGQGVTPGTAWLYAASTGRISLYNAFQDNVQPFMDEGYGPTQGFSKFFEACTRLLIERSAGKVRVLSNWPDGPDTSGNCNFWTDIQFPGLTGNQRVTSIWLVDRKAWHREKQIWPEPKTEKKQGGEPNPQPPTSGRRRGGRPNLAVVAPLVLGGGVGSAGLTLGTGIGGIGSIPIVPPYDDTDDKKPGGQITDVLDSTVGELPSTIGQPPEGGKMSTAFGTQSLIDTLGTDGGGSSGLFGGLDKDWSAFGVPTRRHLGLQARFGPSCPDYFANPSTPPFTPSLVEEGDDETNAQPANQYAAPGALIPALATVQVMQYEENFPTLEQTGHCHVEISITVPGPDSVPDQLGSLSVTDAPPGQDLIVWSSLPYALHVSVGGGLFSSAFGDSQTVYFKYASDTPYAKSWDMKDKSAEHGCQIGPWNQGMRGVYCKFAY